MSDTPTYDEVQNGTSERTPLERLIALENSRVESAGIVAELALAHRQTRSSLNEFADATTDHMVKIEREKWMVRRNVNNLLDAFSQLKHTINRQGLMLEVLFHTIEKLHPEFKIREQIMESWEKYDQKNSNESSRCQGCGGFHEPQSPSRDEAEQTVKSMMDAIGAAFGDATLNLSGDGLTVQQSDGSTMPLMDWLDQKAAEVERNNGEVSVTVMKVHANRREEDSFSQALRDHAQDLMHETSPDNNSDGSGESVEADDSSECAAAE